jgi:cytochrome c oxidase cbb3-type subunit III
MTAPRVRRLLAGSIAPAIAVVMGCSGGEPAYNPAPPQSQPDVVTSDLQAGPYLPVIAATNPYEGDARATAEGRRYYTDMNCGGCHGAAGGGGIGPPFADEEWIYGSAPQNIYQSIVQGRPNGMPAFGGRISDERLWMIVAYIQSLSTGTGAQPAQERADSSAAAGGGTRARGDAR